ncbi:unnamed protein product [Prorocentrum cordatum]|uniref:Galectin n=1 Tax=Prorocentrum cordatum TaxID=2364126 RepID=A0ABN9VP92_9DINO|nr:unnamed protein product [Polarella glacialis]
MRGRARAAGLGLLLLARAPAPAEPHAAVTRPAMRHNPWVNSGWCPWCQGTQQFCDLKTSSCLPPSPCWDADPGTRVARDRFGDMQSLRTPEGDFWIDEGGPDQPAPVLCPGDAVPVHFVIMADHNGAYRWEAQRADPGEESEAAFQNFTPWISLNNDGATEYFRKDGVTPHETDRCSIDDDNRSFAWSWSIEDCRKDTWARTLVALPSDMPPGRHVLRWLWLGGLTTEGRRVVGPEPAIFVNCVDVVVGEGFGGGGPYVSGGGGSSGGASGVGPCLSGQYQFSREAGWMISVTATQAEKKRPYRAFAYCQFCMGRPYGECWGDTRTLTFSFSFKTSGVAQIGAYVKLLFWSDSGNILGLLPPRHPNGQGALRLVAFVEDDFPNRWAHEAEIQDGRWYDVEVDFLPATGEARVSLDGSPLGSARLPVAMLSESTGPQVGVYSFDLPGGGAEPWPREGFRLWLRDFCLRRRTGPPEVAAPTPASPALEGLAAGPEQLQRRHRLQLRLQQKLLKEVQQQEAQQRQPGAARGPAASRQHAAQQRRPGAAGGPAASGGPPPAGCSAVWDRPVRRKGLDGTHVLRRRELLRDDGR